jgi:folate-dependent phosphoribosylglycinamide formyltransferase PurN
MSSSNGKPKILVFASGTPDPAYGGSGFENLVTKCRTERYRYDIVGVVSNYDTGSIKHRAARLRIPFYYFDGTKTAERYREIAQRSGAEWFALSGWLPLVKGLEAGTFFGPATVFNIHPGPLPAFGGKGMHGMKVHEAVFESMEQGLISETSVTMHFVDEGLDTGPVFFDRRIALDPKKDTAESIAHKVCAIEHRWQPVLTQLVVNGKICWDGCDRASLCLPPGQEIINR